MRQLNGTQAKRRGESKKTLPYAIFLIKSEKGERSLFQSVFFLENSNFVKPPPTNRGVQMTKPSFSPFLQK